MATRNSKYSDRYYPPYFRIPGNEMGKYAQMGRQKWKKLTGFPSPRPSHTSDYANELWHEVATPTTIRRSWGDQDPFDFFNWLLGIWDAATVETLGPIRRLYYFALSEGADTKFVGGLGVDKLWLYNDVWLSEILDGFGATWSDIEDAMTAAFLKSLPEVYLPLVANAPKPIIFMLWRHDLVRWRYFAREGKKVTRATDQLLSALRFVDFGPPEFKSTLREIKHIVEPAPWTLSRLDTPRLLSQCCTTGSPIVKGVTLALDAALWQSIRYQQETPRLAPFAQHIYDMKFDISGKKSQEYWMFLADILHHLQVAKGLPNHYIDGNLYESPHGGVPTHTANALRLIVQRNTKL